MIMGVVADDVTGANDIGIMFARSGLLVHVYAYDGPGVLARARASTPGPEVAILDTNSRLDAPEVAYRKVFEGTRELQAAGCRQFFNKTCSVFRGNIGAEFDAMLDALGEEFGVVVLGFPKNGRTTIDGIHYVHGRRLEESEFRNDPIHPRLESNLVNVLEAQTQRRVALVDHRVVAAGPAAVRERLLALQAMGGYAIVDVPDQAALGVIASAAHDFRVLCGSSALAEDLPNVWGVRATSPAPLDLARHDDVGLLCIAGSLMPQTAAQVHYLRMRGAAALVLDTTCLFGRASREAELARVEHDAVEALRSGRDVIVSSSGDSANVEETRAAGTDAGLDSNQVARLVSDALSQVAAGVMAATGLNRLVVAGGETSAAVCARLGVTGMRVWQEIQPGLPSCVSLSNPPMLLVLKSGSFGSPDFLERALDHLRSQ
jgi:uncharacterized protein YgbK (DUF1537 family)